MHKYMRHLPACLHGFMRVGDASSKRIFGVPLELLQTSSRSPLPPCIIEIMRFLQTTEQENLGIFRKAGNRKNINELRKLMESVDLIELQHLLSGRNNFSIFLC